MDLSIIIVNWNTRDDLRACLESISGAVKGLAHEVFVVDNASSDGSAEMVAAEFPQVRLIHNATNAGFAHANNQAVPQSTGRYVLLLNPDTVAQPGVLELLVAGMDAHPEAGIGGAKLLNSDGSLQYSCRRFPTFTTGLFRNRLLDRIFPANRQVTDYLMKDFDHAKIAEVDWVSGAALCIRRETLERIGLLDETFFMYCEDVDWCFRAWQAGWKVLYFPDSVITHHIGRASDHAIAAMVRAHHNSMGIYYRKHYAQSTSPLIRWLPPLGIWVRMQMVLMEKRRKK